MIYLEDLVYADCLNRTSDLRITSATRYPCAKPAFRKIDDVVLFGSVYEAELSRAVLHVQSNL